MDRNPAFEEPWRRIEALEEENRNLKRTIERLQKHDNRFIEPPSDELDLTFLDLFDLEEIQEIQDAFAEATGVASLITHPDGSPITKPSNFCRLCREIIRSTKAGLANCMYSDSLIGRYNPDGPIIRPCLSAGLSNAGASIRVGDKHIANWLIGQVRSEAQSEEEALKYAGMIGVDEEEFLSGWAEIPIMPAEQFEQVSRALFLIANQISEIDSQNVHQSRYISELRQAEKALRSSEAKLKSIFRTAPIGIGRISPGILKEVNERLCEMLGYSAEELIGESTRIFYPSEQEFERVTKEQYSQINNWGTGIVETRWQKKSASIIDVLLNLSPLDLSDLSAGVTFTALDITERKRAEAALIESQESFRELVELLPETILETDTSGNLSFVNQNAFDYFGFSQQDLDRGVSVFDLFSAEDQQRIFENVRKVISGEKIGLNEHRALRKDGSSFPAIVHLAAKLRDGKPVGLRGIVIDITETKKLEERLRQAHKMEAVGTLAGGIAHDFNNLLQAVQGYAELLLLDKTESQPGYQKIREISHAAERGSELVQRLLTFSRKVESELRPIDINRTINQVKAILERTIPKVIKIEVDLMENLYRVNADALQIEQVLMNLAGNARDAMPGGGKLVIQSKNVTLDGDYCRTHPEVNVGKYVLITVSDTGQGMDKTALEHIFDPFFTTKEVGKGSGLGLAMVYGIVKSHHGHISCYSEPGRGCSFQICLPAIESVRGTSPTSATGDLKGGSETILLVDDEVFMRDVGYQILTKFGYRVLTAANGEEALEFYRKNSKHVDLVVVDLFMPILGGCQCVQEILKINPQAKVLIANGHSPSGPMEGAINAVASGFMSKPYDLREMLKTVRNILDEGRLSRQWQSNKLLSLRVVRRALQKPQPI